MALTFNAKDYSTAGLHMMYESISKAHKTDRDIPEGQVKTYSVCDFKDWKIQSDEIEKEFNQRNEKFTAIPW